MYCQRLICSFCETCHRTIEIRNNAFVPPSFLRNASSAGSQLSFTITISGVLASPAVSIYPFFSIVCFLVTFWSSCYFSASIIDLTLEV